MLRTPGGFLSRFTTRTPQYQPLQPDGGVEEDDDDDLSPGHSSSYALTDGPEHSDSVTSTSGRGGGGGEEEDAASRLLRKNREGRVTVTVTAEDDRRVLRRIDLVVLPIMLTVYFLQSIDKSALAYSSMFGLIEDTGLEGDQYGWLNSIVYVAQLIMQPPLAWLLVRLPIAKFTSVMVLAWGATLTYMAMAHNFHSLLVARFFLGAFEASVGPAFIAITSIWWKRGEQTARTSYWYAMNGITVMFGSLITHGLGHIGGSLHSYQIIFIFFGLITVGFSFVMWSFMPDSPVEAKFLDDHDKLIALERLRMNQMGVASGEWRNDHLKEAFSDLKTYLWFALLFSISIPSGGIAAFGPLIIGAFGFDNFTAILMNIPFGAIQLTATIGAALLAQRIKKKGPVIALLCAPPALGCVVLMSTPHESSHQVRLLIGYYLLAFFPGITPLIFSWAAQNTAGDTKRKCNNAILLIGSCIGNVIGPLLYRQDEAPEYTRGLQSNFLCYIWIMVLVAITMLYLSSLNKSHARRRVAMGKSAVIVDLSLDSPDEAAARRQALQLLQHAEDGEAGGNSAATESHRVGEGAFENRTDLQNEEFVFVY